MENPTVSQTVVSDLVSALVSAGEASGATMPATRALILNATLVSEDAISALKTVLKNKGFDGSIISKYCGKNGLWRMGRDNPDTARAYLKGDGAKIVSVQTLYTGLKAAIALAIAPPVESIEDAMSQAATKAEAEAEKRVESMAKSCDKISAAQVLAALGKHAESIADVNTRREWLVTLANGLADVVDALDRTVSAIEQAATTE